MQISPKVLSKIFKLICRNFDYDFRFENEIFLVKLYRNLILEIIMLPRVIINFNYAYLNQALEIKSIDKITGGVL